MNKKIIIEELEGRIESDPKLRPTPLSIKAGLSHNFLHLLFRGKKKRLCIDEIDSIARALGFKDAVEYLVYVKKQTDYTYV